MPHPPVYVRATFISTKAGSNPSMCIDSPVDISDLLGDIRSNQYEKLKSQISSVVDDPKSSLFFHKDSLHKYKFDESSLQNGAVYGMKDMRKKDGSDGN